MRSTLLFINPQSASRVLRYLRMLTPRRVRARLVSCAAAAAFSLLTLPESASAQQAAPPRSLNVTVMDGNGGWVTGLTRESFTVLDGGRPSEIVSFAAGDMPATVCVLLDASASFNTVRRGLVRGALAHFLKVSHPSDEFFVIAFNQSPQLLQGMTGDPAAVLGAIDRYASVEPKGQTAIYDSLYLGLHGAARGRHAKRAVVLVTDGQDNVSRYKFNELRRELKESDVTVYAVGVVDANGDSALDYGGRAVLEELAGLSGGKAFFPSTVAELNDTFDRIAFELRNQYVIGFAPSAEAKRDGWHEVRVKLAEVRVGGKKVKVYVRTRAGFYDVPPPRRDKTP